MAELDGVWKVERLSGLLPPTIGTTKRIAGSSGETRLGSLPGVPFAVEGFALRYRGPFSGFVDFLEPDGPAVYAGRATFRGREFGRFRMYPTGTYEEGAMASETLKGQLVKHLDEAVAMEQNVLRMLDSMITSTDDDRIKEELRHHKLETEGQIRIEREGSGERSLRREQVGRSHPVVDHP